MQNNVPSRNTLYRVSAQVGYLHAEDGKPERTNMNLNGVLKKTTTFGKPIIFESRTPYTKAAFDCKSKGMVLVASTYCEGYIDNGTAVCVPYDGKYGKGFILCSQHIDKFTWKTSTKYMDIDYWVYPKED